MSKEINDYRKVLDILSDKDITGIYSISHQGGEYIVDFLDETTRLDISLHIAETELNKCSNRTCKKTHKFNVGGKVKSVYTGRVYTVLKNSEFTLSGIPLYTVSRVGNNIPICIAVWEKHLISADNAQVDNTPKPKFNVGDTVESTSSGMVYTVTKVLEPRDIAINAVPEEYRYAVSYKGTYPICIGESKLKKVDNTPKPKFNVGDRVYVRHSLYNAYEACTVERVCLHNYESEVGYIVNHGNDTMSIRKESELYTGKELLSK